MLAWRQVKSAAVEGCHADAAQGKLHATDSSNSVLSRAEHACEAVPASAHSRHMSNPRSELMIR